MLDGIPLVTLTQSTLLGLYILATLTGRLIPRRTYDDVVHDRNEWRASHRLSEAARQESADQVEDLLELARTTDAFIRSLPHPGDPVKP